MNIKVLLTGSDGNCCLISYKDTNILIDGGFKTKTKMEEILEPILTKHKIDAIIITHEHTDHLNMWTGRLSMIYNIPIFLHKKHIENEASRKQKYFSFENKKEGKGYNAILEFIEPDIDFQIKDITIHPFTVYHDAKKTLGFRFNNNELTYVSDCGFLSNKIKKELLISDNIALEFNYNTEKLINSPRNYENKIRSLSKFGHLNNEEAIDFLKFAKIKFNKEFKNVITLHTSKTHNNKEIIEKLFKDLNLNTKLYFMERENNESINI